MPPRTRSTNTPAPGAAREEPAPEDLYQTDEPQARDSGSEDMNLSSNEEEANPYELPPQSAQPALSIPETVVRPPTASSNVSSDPEIREARRELRDLKREEMRLVLRQQIRDTRQNVARLRATSTQRTDLAIPISDAEDEAEEGDGRGSKRPRADTLQLSVHHPSRSPSRSRHGSGDESPAGKTWQSSTQPSGQQGLFKKPPPRLRLETKYAGKNISEYQTFMARLDNHFERYKDAYVDDRQKIADAVAEFNDDMLKKWTQHRRDVDEDEITWSSFDEFLKRLIRDPVAMMRDVTRKYANARQRPEESVRDFAAFLKELELLMPPYPDSHRKEFLRAKVLDEVRAEAQKYANEPETYDAFVAHLQTVEDSMPPRRNALKAKKRGTQRSQSRTTGERSERSEQSEDTNRKSSRSSSKIICYYCSKPGHKEDECRKKARDGKKPSEEKSAPKEEPKN
jgi:hypothetical protein